MKKTKIINTTIEHKDSIDAVKGFAIFAVVVGHVIANFFASWSNTLAETPVAMYWWRLIYSFHMPLMMFLSGYLFLSQRVLNESAVKVWIHKIQPLAYPFIFMGILQYLLKGTKDSYWYLRTLMEFVTLQLSYEYFRRKFNLSLYGDLLWCAATWNICVYVLGKGYKIPYFDLIFDISHFQWVWIYFCIGVLFRKYNLFELCSFKHSESFYLLLFAIFNIYTSMGGDFSPFWLHQICTLIIIIAIFYAFNRYKNDSMSMKLFRYMGKHSLEIYIIHGFFLLKLPEIGEFIKQKCISQTTPLTGLSIEILVAVILSLLCIAMSAVVYESLKAFPLIYRLFLGRDVSKK